MSRAVAASVLAILAAFPATSAAERVPVLVLAGAERRPATTVARSGMAGRTTEYLPRAVESSASG